MRLQRSRQGSRANWRTHWFEIYWTTVRLYHPWSLSSQWYRSEIWQRRATKYQTQPAYASAIRSTFQIAHEDPWWYRTLAHRLHRLEKFQRRPNSVLRIWVQDWCVNADEEKRDQPHTRWWTVYSKLPVSNKLCLPFIEGSIVLPDIQQYTSLRHKEICGALNERCYIEMKLTYWKEGANADRFTIANPDARTAKDWNNPATAHTPGGSDVITSRPRFNTINDDHSIVLWQWWQPYVSTRNTYTTSISYRRCTYVKTSNVTTRNHVTWEGNK